MKRAQVNDVVVQLPVFSLFGSPEENQKRARNGWSFIEKNVLSPNKTLHPKLRYNSIVTRKKKDHSFFGEAFDPKATERKDSVQTETERSAQTHKVLRLPELNSSLYEAGSSFGEAANDFYGFQSGRSANSFVRNPSPRLKESFNEKMESSFVMPPLKGKVFYEKIKTAKVEKGVSYPYLPLFFERKKMQKDQSQKELEKNSSRRLSFDVTRPVYDLFATISMNFRLKRRGKSSMGKVFGNLNTKKTKSWLQITHPRFIRQSFQILDSYKNFEAPMLPKNATSVRRIGVKAKMNAILKVRSVSKGEVMRFSQFEGSFENIVAFRKKYKRELSIMSPKNPNVSQLLEETENKELFLHEDSSEDSGKSQGETGSRVPISVEEKISKFFPKFTKKDLFKKVLDVENDKRQSYFARKQAYCEQNGPMTLQPTLLPRKIRRKKMPKMTMDPFSPIWRRNNDDLSSKNTAILSKFGKKGGLTTQNSPEISNDKLTQGSSNMKFQLPETSNANSLNSQENNQQANEQRIPKPKKPSNKLSNLKWLSAKSEEIKTDEIKEKYLEYFHESPQKIKKTAMASPKLESIASLFKMHQLHEQTAPANGDQTPVNCKNRRSVQPENRNRTKSKNEKEKIKKEALNS